MNQVSLRVLHICPRPSFSGLESYALATAEAQKAEGLAVTFVVLPDSPLEQKCAQAGIKTILLDANFAAGFKRGLINSEWDIVHLHSTQDLKLVWLAFALIKVRNKVRGSKRHDKLPKLVLQTHILISHTKRDPIHYLKYLMVDELWCSSEPARQLLRRHIPIAPGKIRIVRYGRETTRLQNEFLSQTEARKVLGVGALSVVIGMVSRIDPQKGQKELLLASLPILSERPEFELVFIGGKTKDLVDSVNYEAELNKILETCPEPVRKRIHFLGDVPQSYRYMKGLNIFALPSYSECFALSVLEAQLAGLPVLGTSAGGTPDVVVPGKTGWLFAPRDVKDTERAITEALSDAKYWEPYGQKARERVLAEFDFYQTSRDIVRHYQGLMNVTPELIV